FSRKLISLARSNLFFDAYFSSSLILSCYSCNGLSNSKVIISPRCASLEFDLNNLSYSVCRRLHQAGGACSETLPSGNHPEVSPLSFLRSPCVPQRRSKHLFQPG